MKFKIDLDSIRFNLLHCHDFQLVRSGKISDEFYEATVNVVRDFESVTKEKETLAKVECLSQEKILHLNRTVAALEYEKVSKNSTWNYLFS